MPVLPVAALYLWLALTDNPNASGRAGRAAWAALVLMCGLAVLALWTAAFDGYKSDLWVYLTVARRISDGNLMFDREPFWMEPPAGPHHSILWLIIGLVNRATSLPMPVQARTAGVLTIALMAFASFRLAGAAFSRKRDRLLAAALFTGSIPELWATLELNRNVALAFVLLTAAESLRTERPRTGRLALWIALAFVTHFFGGLLALGAFTLAFAARRDREGRALIGPVLGIAAASPVIFFYLLQSRNPVAASYLWGPGQFEWAGLRWLNPLQLLREVPPPLLLLAAVGLMTPSIRRPFDERARRLSIIGALFAAAVLFTPLYGVWCRFLGGWLALRLIPLAFLWLPATGAVVWLAEQRTVWKAAAVAVAACIYWQGAARDVRDLRGAVLHHRFVPEAQAEAASLRPLLAGQKYIAPEDLAYGLAPLTGGMPFAVPPGRASPYHPFEERSRLLALMIRTNTPACWLWFLGEYPDVSYLVTPASAGPVEQQIWHDQFPSVAPEAVRDTLKGMDALEPVASGRFYTVDRVRTARVLERQLYLKVYPESCPELAALKQTGE